MFLMGVLTLLVKSARFIYVLLALESMVMGMMAVNMGSMGGSSFILLLIVAVSSSVVGISILVNLMMSYGHEYVKL